MPADSWYGWALFLDANGYEWRKICCARSYLDCQVIKEKTPLAATEVDRVILVRGVHPTGYRTGKKK